MSYIKSENFNFKWFPTPIINYKFKKYVLLSFFVLTSSVLYTKKEKLYNFNTES